MQKLFGGRKRKSTLKPSDLRRRKEIRRRNVLIFKTVFTTILLLGIVALLYFGLRLDAVNIHAVDIRGVESLDEEKVRESVFDELEGNRLYLFPNSNTFSLPVRKIESTLSEEFLRAEDINVLRKGFDELIVVINEREPAVVFCAERSGSSESGSEEECFLADNSGVIYTEAVNGTWDQFEVIRFNNEDSSGALGGVLIEEEVLNALLEFSENLNEEGIGANGMIILEDESIEMITESGYSILVNRKTDYSDDMIRLFSALDAEVFDNKISLEEVYEFDLRFGRKIFYRYGEESSVEESAEDPIEVEE
ncbi:MAG: hypothetical protein U5L75_00070 [Candidatus Campbellbacteria bacterium]|nr:hypothetical protein [Candidatus Campbellbacteria bacterium]